MTVCVTANTRKKAMQTLDLVKGGWGDDHANTMEGAEMRMAISQRPADGHVKSDGWEDHTIVTENTMPCDASELQVGDVILVHTTLTLGYITGFGIAVEGAVPGLKMKLVNAFDTVNFQNMTFQKATFNPETMLFESERVGNITTEEFGDVSAWYSGSVEILNDMYVGNTDLIGLEITALPEDGYIDNMRIVTRIHHRQPVRPPAYLYCCGTCNVKNQYIVGQDGAEAESADPNA